MTSSAIFTLILADKEYLKFENTAYRNKKNQVSSYLFIFSDKFVTVKLTSFRLKKMKIVHLKMDCK